MNTLVLFLALSAAEPEATAPPLVSDAPLFDRGNRIRFGASAQGGWRTLAPALVVDAELRIGFQATQWWSVFGLFKGSVAAGGALSPVVMIGALVEAMLTNHFYLGVGPLLAYSSFTGFEESGLMFAPKTFSEPTGGSVKPGFDVRLGVSTARSKPPLFNRFGMSIGLELIGLYHYALSSSSAFGGMATPVSPWWIFTPMVSVGVDTR